MEEGLRLDNLTRIPLAVTSHYQIPAAGSLILRQSEYLAITDEIVKLADFGKLSYVFIPIERKVMPQKAAMRPEVLKSKPSTEIPIPTATPILPVESHPASPLIKRKRKVNAS